MCSDHYNHQRNKTTSIHTRRLKAYTWPLPAKRPRGILNNTYSEIYSPNNGNIKRLQNTIERTNQYQLDYFGNEISLSKFLLTKYQCKLLNKSLEFCPKLGIYNKTEVFNNFKELKRKMKLKVNFGHLTKKILISTD